MTDAVTIRGLRKKYGEHDAVDGLDLTIEEGAFHGLLGPNGAGKTTTIGTLTGLVRPTSGTVQIFGKDVWLDPSAARRLVGVSPQEPNFDDFLGLERILAFHAGYFGMPYERALTKARELLKFFDLYDYRLERTGTLSGGMKRRLLLARALMHEPKLLILDEPTAGVDVELRRDLWQHVRHLNDDGLTVLLTTHYLEEAEALCNDVTVIDKGRLIEQGTPDALRQKYGSKRVKMMADVTVDATDLGFHLDDRGRWTKEGPDAMDHLDKLLGRVSAAGGLVQDLDVSQSRLEDVFVKLTGRGRE